MKCATVVIDNYFLGLLLNNSLLDYWSLQLKLSFGRLRNMLLQFGTITSFKLGHVCTFWGVICRCYSKAPLSHDESVNCRLWFSKIGRKLYFRWPISHLRDYKNQCPHLWQVYSKLELRGCVLHHKHAQLEHGVQMLLRFHKFISCILLQHAWPKRLKNINAYTDDLFLISILCWSVTEIILLLGMVVQFAAFELQSLVGLTERWLIYIPLVVLPMAW